MAPVLKYAEITDGGGCALLPSKSNKRCDPEKRSAKTRETRTCYSESVQRIGEYCENARTESWRDERNSFSEVDCKARFA